MTFPASVSTLVKWRQLCSCDSWFRTVERWAATYLSRKNRNNQGRARNYAGRGRVLGTVVVDPGDLE